ncbi:MAG TPA: DUF3800 domain-containing protein [Bryobacteraceae bacterium]|nr:DUF3800 domain-containing protein [Bryobacteraceae bacterium]
MKCYFDGSEGLDDSNHAWVTLAGFGAPDATWAKFEANWVAMLRDRYPIAPYIHMNELIGWEDPFERTVGWNEEKKNKLIIDAVQLLQRLDRTFTACLCMIDLTANQELRAMGYPVSDPYTICAEICVAKSVSWYNDQHPHKSELAHIFFDRDEQFMHTVKERWLQERTPRHQVTVKPAWDVIENITDVDMRDYPAIQAADMIAWGRSRQLSERERPFRHLLEIIQAVVPSWTYKIDEDVMRRKYPRLT